jgi:hypothetical protein
MSWAETFKINSNMKIPLDKLANRIFYNLAIVNNNGYGDKNSEVVIVPYGRDSLFGVDFAGGTSKIIVLPETVKEINPRTFLGYANLENIFLNEGLEEIYEYAFGGCANLASLRLPSTIKLIHANAFANSGLKDIYVPWSEGEIVGAPWGATDATIHYNS